MNTSSKVNIGIAGLGGMGRTHFNCIRDGKVPRMDVTAVFDTDTSKLEGLEGVRTYKTYGGLLRSGIDAVLIATPHYFHTNLGIKALQAGLHVMVEKPISVHKADCEKLIAAHTRKDRVFAAMFQQRTDPFYTTIREMIRSDELGHIQRLNWIITNWFRPEIYYASGSWRATWKGEGGGVLLNQCPHNLDLWQWMFGMPSRISAHCALGKYHDIEVEDEVTAYMEYDSGTTGVLIASTGEAPGTNRLEVVADRGKLVYENGQLTFDRNRTPTSEFSRTTTRAFGLPEHECKTIELDPEDHGPQHAGILNNFTEAILDGAPLRSPAEEGIHSVELANSMLYSSLTGKTVELPLDGAKYRRMLNKLIRESTFEKQTTENVQVNMNDSWR